MIFLGSLKKISDDKFDIGFIHYMPFDSKVGLGKTETELLAEGALINNIPNAEIIEGKNSTMFYNPLTNSIFYEYVDVPKSKEQIIEDELEELKQQNAAMMLALVTNDLL